MAKLKPKAPRLVIEFKSFEQLVDFANMLNEENAFGQPVGVRHVDGLDSLRTDDYIVKSEAESMNHPGAVLPLPERQPGVAISKYRESLTKGQQKALDILSGRAVV